MMQEISGRLFDCLKLRLANEHPSFCFIGNSVSQRHVEPLIQIVANAARMIQRHNYFLRLRSRRERIFLC